MSAEFLEEAENIAGFLMNYLTDGGIEDPEDGCVLPHSYTTEFFAWLCALLYAHGFGDEWLECALRAIQASLEFGERVLREGVADGSNSGYHWEFKNLALISTESLISERLPVTLNSQFERVVLNWQNLNIDSANWIAMRAVAYQLRHQRFGKVRDGLRSQLELQLLLKMQSAEGFFADNPSSYSMQYHAYALSLLAMFYSRSENQRVRAAFLRGVRFVADFIDPEGDFNYFGRGQRQLFGYASLILALSDAARICGSRAESDYFCALRYRVYRFLDTFRRDDGVFPLVLNHTTEKWGWCNYNNYGDYLAFSGVWLFLAASHSNPIDSASVNRRRYTKVYPGLGLAVVSRTDWFAALSAGGHDLSEPVGLIHSWPSGPACLGGPPPALSCGVDYSGNYIGPIVNDRPVLQCKRGELSATQDAILMTFSLPDFDVEMTFNIKEDLSLTQKLTRVSDDLTCIPMTFIGWRPNGRWSLALPADGTPSPLGLVKRYAINIQDIDSPLRVHLAPATQAATPPTSQDFIVIDVRRSVLQDMLQLFLKVFWVIWVKVLGP